MSKSLVLITGATGHVGFRTLVFALEAGYRVRLAVRNQEAYDKITSRSAVAPYASQLESSVIVPDITVPGAYDEAVKGVEKVVHIASPLPKPTDSEDDIVNPALHGTLGMLESAYKEPSIKKVVITSSVAGIRGAASLGSVQDSAILNENTRIPDPPRPFANAFEAYYGSKAIALNATEKWVRDKKPTFDVINIGPGYVIGRNDVLTDAKDITNGSNGFLMGQLLGQPAPFPVGSYIAPLDDVAITHVKVLDDSITGNLFFPVWTQNPEGPDWADALEFAKKHFPKQVADGTFKVDASTKTHRNLGDASFTERTLGIKFHTYEEAAVTVMEQYLELIGQK